MSTKILKSEWLMTPAMINEEIVFPEQKEVLKSKLTINFVMNPTPFGNVWIGEHPRYDEGQLMDLGFTHVISVTNHPFQKSTTCDVMVLHVSIKDGCGKDVNIIRLFSKNYHFFQSIQKKNKNKIYVHCEHGVSRSSSFVIFMMMKMAHLSYDTAFLMLKTDHPVACPHHSFQSRLIQFGNSFGKRQDWFLHPRMRKRIPSQYHDILQWITSRRTTPLPSRSLVKTPIRK